MLILNPKHLPERGSPEFKDYRKSEIEILYKQFREKHEILNVIMMRLKLSRTY